MQEHDKRKFAEILKVTYTELYQREALTKNGLQMWWAIFAPYTIDQFSAAVSQHCARPGAGKFAPKPADILELINGSVDDRSVLAWHQVVQSIARVGQYQSVCFDDHVTNKVIEQMGGWPKLCSTPEHELPFRARDFERTYKALHGKRFDHPPHLPGAHERDNASAGRDARNNVILIGQQDQARAVLETGTLRPALLTTAADFTKQLISQEGTE